MDRVEEHVDSELQSDGEGRGRHRYPCKADASAGKDRGEGKCRSWHRVRSSCFARQVESGLHGAGQIAPD